MQCRDAPVGRLVEVSRSSLWPAFGLFRLGSYRSTQHNTEASPLAGSGSMASASQCHCLEGDASP
jgi:hypothetical protein